MKEEIKTKCEKFAEMIKLIILKKQIQFKSHSFE